ncbi:MAG: hypothetical protein U0U70_15245 [Chitinophagaceae bacterium]
MTEKPKSTGFIQLPRAIQGHWLYQDPVKLKRWLDIYFAVNYVDNKVLIGNTLIECKRGQTIRSLQTWALHWRITKKSVKTFFELLQGDGLIVIENVKKSTRITICNYDSYKNDVNDNDADDYPDQETNSKRQLPPKEEGKKDKERKKVKKLLFRESEYFDFEVLKQALTGTKYLVANLSDVHESITNWSDENLNKKIDWLAAVKNWIKRDLERSRPQLTNGNSQLNVFRNGYKQHEPRIAAADAERGY